MFAIVDLATLVARKFRDSRHSLRQVALPITAAWAIAAARAAATLAAALVVAVVQGAAQLAADILDARNSNVRYLEKIKQ